MRRSTDRGPAIGIFTEPEVMLTIRPKRRSIIPSITAWMSWTGAIMFASSPASMPVMIDLAEVARRRAAIVVDEDVDLIERAEQSRPALRRRHVAGDGDHLGAGLRRDLVAHPREQVGVAAIDRDAGAGTGQLDRAGAAQPLARRADERGPAGDPEIHQPLTLSSTPRRASTSRYSATSSAGTGPSVAASISLTSPTLRRPSTRLSAS